MRLIMDMVNILGAQLKFCSHALLANVLAPPPSNPGNAIGVCVCAVDLILTLSMVHINKLSMHTF